MVLDDPKACQHCCSSSCQEYNDVPSWRCNCTRYARVFTALLKPKSPYLSSASRISYLALNNAFFPQLYRYHVWNRSHRGVFNPCGRYNNISTSRVLHLQIKSCATSIIKRILIYFKGTSELFSILQAPTLIIRYSSTYRVEAPSQMYKLEVTTSRKARNLWVMFLLICTWSNVFVLAACEKVLDSEVTGDPWYER